MNIIEFLWIIFSNLSGVYILLNIFIRIFFYKDSRNIKNDIDVDIVVYNGKKYYKDICYKCLYVSPEEYIRIVGKDPDECK